MSRIQHAADLRDREKERLVALGLNGAPGRPGLKSLALKTRMAAIWAYKLGHPVGNAIERALQPARDQIVTGMVTAHLQGRYRAKLTHERARGNRLSLAGDPFMSALDFLERRLELNPAQVVDLADAYSSDVDTIVRALGADVSDKVNEAVTGIVRSGLHTTGGIAELRQAFDASGMGPQSDWLLETTYRTQVATAYSAGQWNANQDPAIDEILWGYVYTTVGDDRVRPSHAAMDGTRAPKGDPLWETWFPPCGYNCRCTAIEIFHGDPAAVHDVPTGLVNVDGVLVAPGPDKGWDFNPGALYRDALGLLGVN